jgi:hypothetical protein
MKFIEDVEVRFNLEIDLMERGKRKRHHRSHNIVVNTGRQFLAEVITPKVLGPGAFIERTQDTVVRYVGFGLGGTRQISPNAFLAPYANLYPGGYEYAGAPHQAQTDTDVTVARLERPAAVVDYGGPTPLWMRQISTPGTFDAVTRTKFIAVFSETDINFGGFTSVPLSEIGLYKSSADPTLPNGGAGAYPGPTGHMIAYDTFDSIQKTGVFSIEVRWEWRF